MSIGDLLYEFTEYLRSTPINEESLAISNWPLSLWIGEHFWAIPIMQVTHILAIAAAFGSVVMINMRILGLSGAGRTMTQTVQRYLPWTWWALLALILSGIGMIIGEPVRSLVNPVFWVKMGLIVAMVLLSVAFHLSVIRPNLAQWEVTHDGRVAVRSGAVFLTLLWCAIIVAGRWIAYAPV